MSTTAEPSPDLLSMPNEVLANIYTYATDGDDSESRWREGKSWLKAVRLTCKQLYDPATIQFGKRHLSDLSIIAVRGSLEELLKICEHRLLGPQVRKISLFGCRLDQKMLSTLKKDLDFWVRRRDLKGIRRARFQLQLFLDFLEEEVELEYHNGVFQLLVDALSKIRSYGHSISVAVFTNVDDGTTLNIKKRSSKFQSAGEPRSETRSIAMPFNNRSRHSSLRHLRVVVSSTNSHWKHSSRGTRPVVRTGSRAVI